MNLPSLPFPPEEPPSDEKLMRLADASDSAPLERIARGKFLDHTVSIYSSPEAPLWNGKEVCECLGIVGNRRALGYLDDDEKTVRNAYGSSHGQAMTFITESGLYHLVFLSRKPEARAFRKWVTAEVLPSLRRFGQYPPPKFTPKEPLRLTAELAALLPVDAQALPLRHQVLVAERIKLVRYVETAPHPGMMARCRAAARLNLGRKRSWGALTIWRFHKRYTTSGGDWRELDTHFERSGRRKQFSQRKEGV